MCSGAVRVVSLVYGYYLFRFQIYTPIVLYYTLLFIIIRVHGGGGGGRTNRSRKSNLNSDRKRAAPGLGGA